MDTIKALRILYAEDSPDDAEMVKREIRKSFPEVIFKVVDTREAFIHALQAFQADLVLSDYSMPSFSGLEALKISLELQPELPVLIVTGSINEETAVECL
ncbi:response regulator, partial [uncultured Sunxiuqinia sp.]|uniref:response regulator n=1 Tax=uncultured Sunxiuqinia sp. TaxID=1573825 RepID=UPI0030DC902A